MIVKYLTKENIFARATVIAVNIWRGRNKFGNL